MSSARKSSPKKKSSATPAPPPKPNMSSSSADASGGEFFQLTFDAGEEYPPTGITFFKDDGSIPAPKAPWVIGATGITHVVRAFAQMSTHKEADLPFSALRNAHGRFTKLQEDIDYYNSTIESIPDNPLLDAKSDPDGALTMTLHRHKILRTMLQGLGVDTQCFRKSRDGSGPPCHLAGLAEVLAAINKYHADEISENKDLISRGSVTFGGLLDLYVPGREVWYSSSGLGGERIGCTILSAAMVEVSTMFGKTKEFHMDLEFYGGMGNAFTSVSYKYLMEAWQGPLPISGLKYQPMTAEIKLALTTRGLKYAKYGVGAAQYLSYGPNSFYLHRARKVGANVSTSSGVATGSPGGRVMVDVNRGHSEGQYPCMSREDDEQMFILAIKEYMSVSRNAAVGSGAPVNMRNGMSYMKTLPRALLWNTWPAVIGFSFSAKAWGHVLVSSLNQIKFEEKAFDTLVLPSGRKELIQALVSHSETTFTDIISGKGGGSVFLLHGPPGVGKTLTAEAIAELLHRPLYSVTMGELGTTPDELESRLKAILDVCAEWGALILIDEADVFMERRGKKEVVRNAMVCVMLRLIEYYEGVLFLTSNRVRSFDPAFQSRVTVALKYENLSVESRKKVWDNLLAAAKISGINTGKLSKSVLNGRQIKNSIRLAQALAAHKKSAVKQEHLDATLAVITDFQSDWVNQEATEWDEDDGPSAGGAGAIASLSATIAEMTRERAAMEREITALRARVKK